MALLRLLTTLLLAVAVVVSAALYTDFRSSLQRPLQLPANADATLTVPSGRSFAALAADLEQRGIIPNALYWQLYGRLRGVATQIRAGEYTLTPGITPQQLLELLVAGPMRQYSLTVVEGWTFRQLLEALHQHPKIDPQLKGLSGAEIMNRLGHPEQHPEGRFFPDTYYFPAGTTDLAFLQRAHRTMADRLAAVWQQRAEGLPLKSPDEALVLASIVEKETGVSSERRQVAGVFTRRLRRGMRLQTDPTVIYGIGAAFDGNLTRRHLRTDTPYNTYTRHGLPPTPIALPGAAALAAAVDPAPGDTLYFVADGEGGHVFSRTLQEHNRAVRRYQLGRP